MQARVAQWIEKSGYTSALGVRLESLDDASARLRLPFRPENSNDGRALHGGCAASLAVLGAQVLARATLGEAAAPWHTSALHVSYLAAALGEPIIALARLLRGGKEMCFVETDVSTEAGKPVAHASAMVRGRFASEEPVRARCTGDDGTSDPGTMGPHIGRIPFMAARGIHVELMRAGRSRLILPLRESNADASAGVHEGAVIALLDTTGAMAAWAETGLGPYKASTPALQAQILAPPPAEELVGYGQVVQRDREIFFSAVEIATRSGLLVARGTVIYRILT